MNIAGFGKSSPQLYHLTRKVDNYFRIVHGEQYCLVHNLDIIFISNVRAELISYKQTIKIIVPLLCPYNISMTSTTQNALNRNSVLVRYSCRQETSSITEITVRW